MDIRQQNWGDDLRLPTLVNAADVAELLDTVEPHRRPPIPFQSKHIPSLKRDVWYALQRPADKSRAGLLVVWPARKCCVYVGAAKAPNMQPKVALLRLRVDPQFLATGVGPTIFVATLSAASRRLWVEDVLLWKGRSVAADETFSSRWCLCAQWLEHYCIVDTRLLGDVDLRMANWTALQNVYPEGVWEFQINEPGRRRLMWIVRHVDSPVVGAASPALSAAPEPLTLPAAPTMPVLNIGPLVAVATRSGGPDQWALTSADGVGLGRALIRTLEVSATLRSAKTDTLRLEVEWNATFKKWEVRGVAASAATATHSSFFAGHE